MILALSRHLSPYYFLSFSLSSLIPPGERSPRRDDTFRGRDVSAPDDRDVRLAGCEEDFGRIPLRSPIDVSISGLNYSGVENRDAIARRAVPWCNTKESTRPAYVCKAYATRWRVERNRICASRILPRSFGPDGCRRGSIHLSLESKDERRLYKRVAGKEKHSSLIFLKKEPFQCAWTYSSKLESRFNPHSAI